MHVVEPQAPIPHSDPVRIGLGLLRMNLALPSHAEAARSALAGGVRDFDLGFLEDEATFARARDLAAILGAIPSRVIVRGGLGTLSAESIARVRREFPDSVSMSSLLSDPEFALASLEGNYRELDTRIRHEARELEKLCDAGVLQNYGIGSAGFTYPKDDPEYLSLSNLLASESGERFPHFSMVEFPLNLYESAAVLLPNQSLPDSASNLAEDVSAIECANHLGLEVYSRRPFDAITETQLLRLVAYPDHHRVDLDQAVIRTLEAALEAESVLIAKIPNAKPPIHWAHRLRRQLVQVRDPEQWKQILQRRIEPELAAIRGVSERYDATMDALLLAVGMWFEKRAAERNERIRSKIVEAAPALRMDRSLAKTAIRIYRSIRGLNCVFVGMRSPHHVEEVLSSGDPLPFETAIQTLETAHVTIHDAIREQESMEGTQGENHEHSEKI